ncbi:MAG: two-component system, OmpR family, phosphate regulon sensor histidine kinase PhoR [Pseudomonadota bacterium]|nr:two-component system, OmpR family, phosphate regulon sensor histidine kinase PhoR [Pseudomonadota bacterium]
MSKPLIQTLALSLALGVPAAVLGILVSPVIGLSVFCAVLALQLIGFLRNFSRLEAWTRNPLPETTPEGGGIWDEVFSRLHRHEKELRVAIARRDFDLQQVAAAGQAMVDGIVTLDADSRISWCNRVAEQQLGLDLRSDRFQPIANLVRQPAFINYLATGDFSKPLRLSSMRGDERVLSLFVLPYSGQERLLQIQDVTQSERLDQTRRDFVANVSHELRTPLTILSGFLETVRELELDPVDQEHYFDLMAEQSVRMSRIVQDLLALSTLESAPPPSGGERVHMTPLLEKLHRDAQALSAGRHSISLEMDTGDLFGAESELASAFGNLISNAVRYTPPGGEIVIAWKRQGSSAEFSVTDNGIGIDAKHIPRLTERFYRADTGRSRETGGTGLGLAIVKHALSRHQARLEITSTPGEGSRFSTVFPPTRVAA